MCWPSTADNMTESEQQPAPPPLKRRRFQYSLRTIFVLTGITAAFFSVAFSLGYVDALVALAALGVLVGLVQYPRRVHLATGVLLAMIAGTLLWANLRSTGWQWEFGLATPTQTDPITKAMFWRGWPLSPCMVCLQHGMRFHPEQSAVQVALVVDGVLFVVALLAVRIACELCFRWRDKPIIETPPNLPQPQSGSPSGRAGGEKMVH